MQRATKQSHICAPDKSARKSASGASEGPENEGKKAPSLALYNKSVETKPEFITPAIFAFVHIQCSTSGAGDAETARRREEKKKGRREKESGAYDTSECPSCPEKRWREREREREVESGRESERARPCPDKRKSRDVGALIYRINQ